ncbi:hypothetical protein ACVGVM_00065 [Pseudonocardia bannensis]|uniref:Lipoprotein n=1 Tax=Pseudonocardia bannensis TaxID=630973 RepID=A0A848DFS9_9PSEU|nr:hypothetical protein [Pseudonocardia bannensis]NMH91510.1 hypothetical protein [Pseudonocardia bannensis]
MGARPVVWASVSCVAALLLTGCSGVRQDAVTRSAAAFTAAVAAGNAGAACAQLTPATRAELEWRFSAPCAAALGELRLPVGTGPVAAVSVWGGSAQVRLADDTLFLSETAGGWKVAAAGCQEQGEAPYRCELEGP